MLVANPEFTIPPKDTGTDVLKTYVGVVNVGVGMRKFGSVVGMVVWGVNAEVITVGGDCTGADAEIVLVMMSEMVRGYNPILGDSLVSIP